MSTFIDYRQVEELLSLYPRLIGLLNSLQVDLQATYIEGTNEEDEGDVIYALVVGNRRLDGLPKPPYRISDKTCNIAFVYKRAVTNTNRSKIKKLSYEILEVNTIIEKIDIAIGSLDRHQQKLIDQVCFKGMAIGKFVLHSVLEERRAKKEKRKALEAISKIVRITEEAFYNIISKVG